MDNKTAQAIGQGTARFAVNVTGAAITAGTGSAAAGMALNVDANNRQLHPDQTRAIRDRARELAGRDGLSAHSGRRAWRKRRCA